MRILIDVNLSRTWKEPLVAAGHDAIHWEDVGAADADDADIMQFADAGEYIILTNDLDFAMMLALSMMRRPSVVQLRSGSLRPGLLRQQVITALRQAEAALTSGALVTVMPRRLRISILPLRSNPKS